MTRRLLALAWAWLLCAGAASGQGVLDVGARQSHDLASHIAVLEDPERRLRLQDILAPAQQARFRPATVTGPGANFGLTQSAIWLRVELRTAPGSNPNWLLELGYPPLDRLELYAPDATGAYAGQVAGDLLPFAARPVPHRNHVLPVRLRPGERTTLYLRLTSDGTIAAPLRLWRAAALWRSDQASYALLSLYFGLLMGLLLYNLLLFVSVRDRAYLVYVLFVAGMAVAQLALTGLGYQYLWPEQHWWNSVSPPAGLCVAAVFGLLFARSFLGSREGMPRTDRTLLALTAAWALSFVTALALPYVVSTWLVTLLAPASVVVLVVSGVVALLRGHAGAKHYLAAWALLLIGVFTLFLHNTGVLPSNPVTSNALLIGSALEMVLLSFALADRINVARRFKEQAQVRIAAEHAMVEALGESQRRLRTVLEEREIILQNSIVGIAFLTARGRLRWANRAMLEMFGAGDRPVTSMEPFYLAREQYLQVGAEVAAAAARGEAYQRELEMQRSDGTRMWVLLSGKAVSQADLEQGTVWVVMDITRRKQLEAQLQRTMAEREAVLEQQKALTYLRARFVAMTSHEFRTPLAAILSAEELLRHYGDRLPLAERLEILDTIAEGAQRMARMLDRVLLLGRADAQMLEFRPVELDLQALCRELVEEARLQHPQAKALLACETAPEAGAGRYDEKLLRHIFGNLLSNAVKYSPAGGRVSFEVSRDGDATVFRVRDQGIGIPADEIPHLFESFHRASNVGEIPGTGLGLAIVKNAVERHGGTIAVESELGAGTTFTVRIPNS